MHRLDSCFVIFVHVVHEDERLILHGDANERRATMRHQLHGYRKRAVAHFDFLDHLVKFEIANHQHITLPDETEMQRQVSL